MGMFDTIRCQYPLPGELPPEVASLMFQSKDLDCLLDEYELTTDGQLVVHKRDADGAPQATCIPVADYTGVVNMYWSNVVASGPGVYTANGEDAWHLEFAVTLHSGRVVEVRAVRNDRELALESQHLPWRSSPREDRPDAEQRRQ